MIDPITKQDCYEILVDLDKRGLIDHRINPHTGVDEWKITETGKQWIKEQTEPLSLYD